MTAADRLSVDTFRLSGFVVRVRDENGRTRGSGFIAAPGTVLTAAHVVRDLNTVTLETKSERVQARVVARSPAPPEGAQSALWPFPDLAVLQAPDLQHAPCVLLSKSEPDPESHCGSWGYSVRESEVEAPGDPGLLTYSGVSGDGFYSFVAGQVIHGLSGAPVVCPHRRAVIGVVSATRDAENSLGGWVSPIAGLAELATDTGELLDVDALTAASASAVLQDRRSWLSVLPVRGASHALDPAWAEYTKPKRAAPSDLLLPDYRLVDYRFRDAVVDEAAHWCLSPEPIAVAVVAGAGGTGKSRFAAELCRTMAEQHGWIAGLPPQEQSAAGRPDVAYMPLPRLVVIDYAETIPGADVHALISRLRLTSTALTPVRILLLTRGDNRSRQESIESLVSGISDGSKGATGAVKLLLADREEPEASLQSLTLVQRQELYGLATQRFATAWRSIAPLEMPDLSEVTLDTPLGILDLALVDVLDAHDRTRTDSDAASLPVPHTGSAHERLLRHEQKYWSHKAPSGSSEEQQRRWVALATMTGAENHEEAATVLAALEDSALTQNDRIEVSAWLSTLHPPPITLRDAYWHPLRPDRIGEALVAEALLSDAEGVIRVLLAATTTQALRLATVISRAATPTAATGTTAAKHARGFATTLFSHHTDLVTEAEQRARPALGGTASIGLARALSRLFASNLTEHALEAEPDNTGYRRDVAFSLNRLGDLAVAVGDGATARAHFQRSLDIAEELAATEPDNTGYRRDVAFSLERLATLETGLLIGEYLDQAIQVRRELHQREPTRVDLAIELATTLTQRASTSETRRVPLLQEALETLKAFNESALGNRGLALRRLVTEWLS